jgi:hypothetical protein
MTDQPISKPRAENWENEGGSLSPASSYAESLGVTTHLTESYRVGGYRYTNLADAIAQEQRLYKQGAAS